MKLLSSIFTAAAAVLLLSGCELRRAMYDQPKLRPLQESTFFADGRASRALIEGTIALLDLQQLLRHVDGKVDNQDATVFPFPITDVDLARGQERFNIYCSPCHDQAGTGQGMIVKRGFKQPPTYHQDRLRTAPVGYLYGVVKIGFGAMAGYSAQIPVEDRWRIVAYVRALQFSQNADPNELPADLRAQLK